MAEGASRYIKYFGRDRSAFSSGINLNIIFSAAFNPALLFFLNVILKCKWVNHIHVLVYSAVFLRKGRIIDIFHMDLL